MMPLPFHDATEAMTMKKPEVKKRAAGKAFLRCSSYGKPKLLTRLLPQVVQ